MREFGKTPKKPTWLRVLEFIFPSWFGNYDEPTSNFAGHNNRMKKRRRKTLFDR